MIEEDAYLKKYSTLQQGTYKIGFWSYSNVSVHFRLMKIMKISNHHNKNMNNLLYIIHIFGLQCCLHH